MWRYEGCVVPLSLQNTNACFFELLLFKLIISHRDLERALYCIAASPSRNVSPGTWIFLGLQCKLVV